MTHVKKNINSGVHSVDENSSDSEMSSSGNCKYQHSSEINGKRKLSYIMEDESDTDESTYETNRRVRRMKIFRNQHSYSDEINENFAVSAQPVSSSLESNAGSGDTKIDNTLPQRDNVDSREENYENVDVPEVSDNSESSYSDAEESISKQILNNQEEKKFTVSGCKHVRFSHDVNIIPGVLSSPCTSMCLIRGKELVKSVANAVKDESENAGECCSSSESDDDMELHACCKCQESVEHAYEEKAECNVKRSVSAVSRFCEPFPIIGGQSKECSICFVSFTDQKVASPDTCSHNFCFVCLQQWAENMNTCPLDRRRFNVMLVKDRFDGNIIEKIRVKNCELEDDDVDNDIDYCEVCYRRSVGREEALMSCNRCGRMYHLACLSSPADISPENWVCPVCEDC